MNSKINLVAMVAVSLSTLAGCGDNSEGPIPGEENAAGWAGSGDYVAPPAGTGGNTQTGGSGGSSQAGTGGSNSNPSTGGSGGGSAGTGGVAGCAGEAGSGGTGGSSEPTCESLGGECVSGDNLPSVTCPNGHVVYVGCQGTNLPGGAQVCCIPDSGSGGSAGTGGTAGSAGSGGSAGTGGSTGGTGGSTGTFCTPNATEQCALSTTCMGETHCKSDGSGYDGTCEDVNDCNSGTGGSSGSGGSGGSAGTGGTAGSGGSSGTGGSGGTGGTASTLGEMVLTINIPVSGTHDIMVFAQDMDPQDGTVDWNDSWNQVGVHQTTYTFKVASGDTVKVNGYYDAPDQGDPWAKQFCDPSTLRRAVSAWATFNGAYVPAPEVLSNGSGGCDLYFHAIALTPSATDSDGDGDPDATDCGGPRHYHGQVESFGDSDNLDCQGGNDPSRVRYRLTTISGLTPVLEDWDRNGLDYPMSSVGSGIYEVLVESPIAPKDFTIDMGVVNGWHTWDVGYNNGSCQRPTYVPVTLTVSDETSGSLYNLVTEVQPGNTCHDVVTNL